MKYFKYRAPIKKKVNGLDILLRKTTMAIRCLAKLKIFADRRPAPNITCAIDPPNSSHQSKREGRRPTIYHDAPLPQIRDTSKRILDSARSGQPEQWTNPRLPSTVPFQQIPNIYCLAFVFQLTAGLQNSPWHNKFHTGADAIDPPDNPNPNSTQFFEWFFPCPAKWSLRGILQCLRTFGQHQSKSYACGQTVTLRYAPSRMLPTFHYNIKVSIMNHTGVNHYITKCLPTIDQISPHPSRIYPTT